MARTVRVADFAAASARYVEGAVKKANVNGNAYLTKAEAAALPKDLQDNFEAKRMSSLSHVVSAREFVGDYAQTVKDAAERADVNGDGVIAATEMRHLPTELQDNYANFARVAAPAAPEAITEVSLPLSDANIQKVRAAFVDYIEHDLTPRRPSAEPDEFDYENRDWANLVRELGGDDEHEALKTEALKMAKSWEPNADWEASPNSDGGVYFTGDFKFITLFIELDKGKQPAFMSEVD
jgi:hypothetical protein